MAQHELVEVRTSEMFLQEHIVMANTGIQ